MRISFKIIHVTQAVSGSLPNLIKLGVKKYEKQVLKLNKHQQVPVIISNTLPYSLGVKVSANTVRVFKHQ